ncbi:zf-TFIIB domain-containing protein [Psychromarinibacter sp. C21-152]|uniref:Zf-TFIIB domain-containing protein n=1 Tax=Psychromarinibacter sediminicola TaxID=3033385 RepID=A0AAE3NWX3_9RHOB|nr:zf-TFIIB domain-containing protein [Psychromarinibacter sediminicola]MDF0603801.1 zf-TFIIB domain-containing protein [Psychromarinibacter sediminicola]
MKCPLCQVDLVMSERHGVEIDYCPKCRGVWLDRGELDKIIEKATEPTELAPPEPEPAPRAAPEPRMWQEPYRQPPRERYEERYDDRRDRYERDEKSYRKKKRKSILSEIFDFD